MLRRSFDLCDTLNALAVGMVVSLTAKELREVLLYTGGSMLAQGRLQPIQTTALGAGVHNARLRPIQITTYREEEV